MVNSFRENTWFDRGGRAFNFVAKDFRIGLLYNIDSRPIP